VHSQSRGHVFVIYASNDHKIIIFVDDIPLQKNCKVTEQLASAANPQGQDYAAAEARAAAFW
jgi:hypothetical protein